MYFGIFVLLDFRIFVFGVLGRFGLLWAFLAALGCSGEGVAIVDAGAIS